MATVWISEAQAGWCCYKTEGAWGLEWPQGCCTFPHSLAAHAGWQRTRHDWDKSLEVHVTAGSWPWEATQLTTNSARLGHWPSHDWAKSILNWHSALSACSSSVSKVPLSADSTKNIHSALQTRVLKGWLNLIHFFHQFTKTSGYMESINSKVKVQKNHLDFIGMVVLMNTFLKRCGNWFKIIILSHTWN